MVLRSCSARHLSSVQLCLSVMLRQRLLYPCRSFGPRLFSSRANHDSESETHFGFETVSEREKTAKVHGVFEHVATKYDQMNDMMSFGIHRWWKNVFVSTLNPLPGMKILDVAGGTGDIAFRMARAIQLRRNQRRRGPSSKLFTDAQKLSADTSQNDSVNEEVEPDITVFDLSESMLEVGKQRAIAQGLQSQIKWVNGNAEALPFEDNTFDAYTIAFGIRNFTHVDLALKEAHRVLKKGGRFMCLEFSEVQNPVFSWVYDRYSMNVIPVMGQVVASDWKSYQYLVESIRMFPNQEEFKEWIQEAGFSGVTYRNLTQGICAIHSGYKLRD